MEVAEVSWIDERGKSMVGPSLERQEQTESINHRSPGLRGITTRMAVSDIVQKAIV
jgi:hypothetical protein